MTSDELDKLLAPPEAPADPALRDKLRAATTRRLRRGRLARRLATVMALAACYGLGAMTVWLSQSPVRQLASVPFEVTNDIPKPTIEPGTEPPKSARELELAAEQADGDASARLFLDAARSFAGQANWNAALRCYRNALDASGGNLQIDPTNDDWLMVTLKLARREEQIHAKRDE